MRTLVRKVQCYLGFHSPKEIGRAIYPYDTSKTILGMGCRYCGKKLKHGYLVDTEMLNDPMRVKTFFKDL